MIWIFTDDEGDGIKSRLPVKMFSTLNFQGLRSNAFDEIGYMSHKFNYMDSLTLIHCFRNLNFHDDFFNDKQFEHAVNY